MTAVGLSRDSPFFLKEETIFSESVNFDCRFLLGLQRRQSKTAHWNIAFPDETPTLLIRKATVSCSHLTGCVAVLIDPSQVSSLY